MENIPPEKRQPNFTQSTTLLFILKITIVILSTYFLIFGGFIYTLLGEGRPWTFNNTIRSGRRLINNDKINESPSTENELPLCVGKLLDKRHYRYESSSRLLMTESGRSCRLLNYTAEKIIHCFDALRHQHSQADKTPFRLIFMGDSIVRQQYLNLVRLIPDYDKLLQPSNAELLFHGDMEVTSASLGLRLSFRWQPYLDDDVVNKLRQWATASAYDNTTRPASSLLLLSMALWHIIEVDHRDHWLYIKHLRELTPSLAQLSQVTRVIWLNQYPPLEFYSDYSITPEKINFYNKAVRRILLPAAGSSSSSRVEIWDSGNPLVEEYVRSCVIHRRYEGRKTSSKTSPGLLALKYYSSTYSNCMDHVHIGYSALSQITQLLYNDICSPISQM